MHLHRYFIVHVIRDTLLVYVTLLSEPVLR